MSFKKKFGLHRKWKHKASLDDNISFLQTPHDADVYRRVSAGTMAIKSYIEIMQAKRIRKYSLD